MGIFYPITNVLEILSFHSFMSFEFKLKPNLMFIETTRH
jgi:hypothetical protein